ncbi:MAG: DUF308 domain-containing protein [Propionibacteriaceae bacterium]|nr:DUF308 domain-containing protein [Propionibacteriaceae bacterium]
MGSQMLQRSATALFVIGALGIIFGLVAMAWPGLSALSFAIIWGIYALADGLSALVLAFTSKDGRGWFIAAGVLGLVAGLLVLARPGIALAALGWVLGVWFTVRGIAELCAIGSAPSAGGKVLVGVGGALWVIAGIAMAMNPIESALGLAWFFGLLAVAWGVVAVISGFQVRKVAKS